VGAQTPSAAMRRALAEADISTNPTGNFGSWVKEASSKLCHEVFKMICCNNSEKKTSLMDSTLVKLMKHAQGLHANLIDSNFQNTEKTPQRSIQLLQIICSPQLTQ